MNGPVRCSLGVGGFVTVFCWMICGKKVNLGRNSYIYIFVEIKIQDWLDWFRNMANKKNR